jgi:beta-mannosidase
MDTVILKDNWTLNHLGSTGPLSKDQVESITKGEPAEVVLHTYSIDKMPCMVHTILEKENIIQTPWKPGGAETCRWVAESDWLYRIEFDTLCTDSDRVRLCCAGVDTVAYLYLNGVEIGHHTSMYSPFELEITNSISDRKNVLLIHVRSVFKKTGNTFTPLKFVDDDKTKPILRSRHNYGAYLGPNPLFSRVGLYGNVEIRYINEGSLENSSCRAFLDDTLESGKIIAPYKGKCGQPGKLVCQLFDPHGNSILKKVVSLTGEFENTLTWEVKAPELWWPRGYGAQPLYLLCIELRQGDRVIDSQRKELGFRYIEMTSPMHFSVNHVPVRLWGANWVTPHWVTAVWDQKRAESLFDLAENAHMNTLRVWGEVEPPHDQFYSLADRRGFLVWHDFTDLCLETTESYAQLSKAGAEQLIRRTQHHPCIFLWCGDNELPMWHAFARKTDSYPGLSIIEEFAQTVDKLDPERFYLPSSPYFGYDPNDPQNYDTHGYTNTNFIHGYDYLVFASEDTRISAPAVQSLTRFMNKEDIYPADYTPLRTPKNRLPWPVTWQSYTSTQSERKTGPVEEFYDATDPESLVYQIGMAAGQYYRDTIERQRRGRPATDLSCQRRCGGYLIWKLNDSWPQIYSAKVDYFLEPYIDYYSIRRSYSPVLVSFDIDSSIYVWVVNDTPNDINGQLTVQAYHMVTGSVTASLSVPVSVSAGNSVVAQELTSFGTLDRYHVSECFINRRKWF